MASAVSCHPCILLILKAKSAISQQLFQRPDHGLKFRVLAAVIAHLEQPQILQVADISQDPAYATASTSSSSLASIFQALKHLCSCQQIGPKALNPTNHGQHRSFLLHSLHLSLISELRFVEPKNCPKTSALQASNYATA